MKKLITILAVFGFATTAFAEDMKQTGSFRTIYSNSDNRNFNDDVGDKQQNITQRLMWSPSFKVSDAVSVHTTLVHAAVWGANADQIPGDANGGPVANPDRGNDVLVVNEAYANWMINDESSVRFGRGAFTMADGRVVSQNTWEQVNKAFDGIMYSRDHEIARGSLFAVRGASDTTGANNTSSNFFGASFDFKSLPEFLKTANLHYVIVKTDPGSYWVSATPGATAITTGEDSSRLGLTVSGDTAGVDYNVTYAMYSGENTGAATTDISASMYDVTVGYSMPDVKNLRVSAQMHSDTGSTGTDDETYRGFHYDTHNNAGLMDVIGYGNLTFMRLGVTLEPKEGCTLGVDYYTFTATEDAAGTFGTAGAAGGNLAIAADDEIGSEIDVWFGHQYSSNFSSQLRYSTFDPGKRLAASGDAQTEIYLEGMMTF